MERQPVVAQVVHLLEHESSEHLLGGQSGAACPWVLLPLRQVREHEIEHLGMCVENLADGLELADVSMLVGRALVWWK